MATGSLVGTIILIFTGLFTYKGFVDAAFRKRYLFDVDGILIDRQWDRMLSSGFLHGSWIHFAFNMIALLSFSFTLEFMFGSLVFAGIYFLSLLGGSVLSLYVHRNHGDYTALGASGAVSGIVAASIILFPNETLSFVIIPIEIKSWILGVLFILISIFGMKRQKDNIGHDAHLGGALTGMILTILYEPSILKTNWWIILLMLVPTIIFLVLIIRNPAVMMIDNYWGESIQQIKTFKQKKKRPYEKKKEREATLNELLDKINKKGMDSLSANERKRLEQLKDQL